MFGLGVPATLLARADLETMTVALEGELTMSTSDELLPAAADCRKKIAEVEAEKATEYLRKQAAADAEKKALLDQLEKPSGVTDEERMKRAATIIRRAVDNGRTEVFVGRFPNQPLHRPRPRHQSNGAGVGDNFDRIAQGAVCILAAISQAARIQD